MKRTDRRNGRASSFTVTAGLLLVAGIVAATFGCKASPTWSATARSPDGKFVARARTFENGGFGTAFIQTTVDLNFTHGSQEPTEILAFSDGPSIPGGMDVGMKWLTSRRLELTFRGKRRFDFRAVEYYGVDISVRDMSSEQSRKTSADLRYRVPPLLPSHKATKMYHKHPS